MMLSLLIDKVYEYSLYCSFQLVLTVFPGKHSTCHDNVRRTTFIFGKREDSPSKLIDNLLPIPLPTEQEGNGSSYDNYLVNTAIAWR